LPLTLSLQTLRQLPLPTLFPYTTLFRSDFTIGIEEELALLDAQTLDLVPRFEELRDAAAATDPLLSEAIAGELISSEIEIRSGKGEDLADAIARQRELRARLVALCTERGVLLGST